MSFAQIPLRLGSAPEQRFASFEPPDAEAVQLLRAAAAGRGERLYVSGPPGSGKSHLLHATCAEAASHGRSIAYLPLAALSGHATAALEAQPAVDLLCIDNLEAVAGNAVAELALFALHNRQSDAGCALVYAARRSADALLSLTLPDLCSRLQHCTRIVLVPLDEAQRREWLQRRAAQRGLQLDDAVLEYLFRHVGRDLGTLGNLLERLDRDSLAAQRRITVPFLRQVLETR
jgi:DnaA-homolog protein